MTWILVYAPKAEKQLKKLHKSNSPILKKILIELRKMEVNPFDINTEKLTDTKFEEYRKRVGNYRIKFSYEEEDLIVVSFIGKRDDNTY